MRWALLSILVAMLSLVPYGAAAVTGWRLFGWAGHVVLIGGVCAAALSVLGALAGLI